MEKALTFRHSLLYVSLGCIQMWSPNTNDFFLYHLWRVDQCLIKLNSIDLLQYAELSWIKESHVGITERLLTSLYSVALHAFSAMVFIIEWKDIIFWDSKSPHVSVYSGAISSKSPKGTNYATTALLELKSEKKNFLLYNG